MFGLVEEAERGVPGAVGAERHDVLQLLQAVPQVRPTVLLELVVGRPANRHTGHYIYPNGVSRLVKALICPNI